MANNVRSVQCHVDLALHMYASAHRFPLENEFLVRDSPRQLVVNTRREGGGDARRDYKGLEAQYRNVRLISLTSKSQGHEEDELEGLGIDSLFGFGGSGEDGSSHALN